MAIGDYSTVAASNTTISSIPLGENAMAPSDVNNAFRQLMADIANGIADGDFASTSGLQPLDASLSAYAALTTAANKGLYFTAADAPATYDLTSFGRTLGGLASYAALKTALGVVTVTSSTLSTTGHLALDLDGDGTADIKLNWGTGTWATPATFNSAFATACWGVIPITTSLIGESDESDEILYVSGKSTTGFSTAIKGDYSSAPSMFYLAIGV